MLSVRLGSIVPSLPMANSTVHLKPWCLARILASCGSASSERYSSSPLTRTTCFPLPGPSSPLTTIQESSARAGAEEAGQRHRHRDARLASNSHHGHGSAFLHNSGTGSDSRPAPRPSGATRDHRKPYYRRAVLDWNRLVPRCGPPLHGVRALVATALRGEIESLGLARAALRALCLSLLAGKAFGGPAGVAARCMARRRSRSCRATPWRTRWRGTIEQSMHCWLRRGEGVWPVARLRRSVLSLMSIFQPAWWRN